MTGVVLCGGQSERMGTDKGLLPGRRGPWAVMTRNKLLGFASVSLISINQTQNETYRSLFRDDELIVDDTSLEVAGPALGLLSVHRQYPDEDLLVLACDLPDMSDKVLRHLVEAWKSDGNRPDAMVFRQKKQVEPLCGIYSARGLSLIHQEIESGNLRKSSMMYILEQMSTSYLPVPDEWSTAFRNANAPGD